MKNYYKTIIRETKPLIPFFIAFGVIGLLYLSAHLLQDFSKIHYIYTNY